MTTARSSITKEYLTYDVTAVVDGSEVDPTSDVVEFAFVAPGAIPVSGDWETGEWESFGSEHSARIMVGPGGAVALTAGTYAVWLRVTDSPEIPARVVDTLLIDRLLLATFADLQSMLPGVELDQTQCELLLAISSDSIRSFTRQTLTLVVDDELVIDAGEASEVWLPERPVVSVTSVTVDGSTVPSTAYRLLSGDRLRFSSCVASWGPWNALGKQATIVHTHGYEVVPWDLAGVCLDMARRGVSISDAGGHTDESIGNYSVKYDASAARRMTTADAQSLLDAGYRPLITSVPIRSGAGW